jgi:hypothetical protein
MRQMESRQRVSSILNSQAFREELESIIADQLKHGPHPASLIALQHISELLLPNGINSSRWHQVSSMGRGMFQKRKKIIIFFFFQITNTLAFLFITLCIIFYFIKLLEMI